MRKYGPKPPDHPSIGEACPGCNVPFKEGDYTTLVPIGPGDDLAARQLAREGRTYSAVSLEVHWGCATGKMDNAE